MVVSQHSQDTFYQDQEVMADFLDYITFLLNHVNPHTGLGEIETKEFTLKSFLFPLSAYKDDPTVLAWETGN